MSHSLPLPISAARASPGSALENLPESATKPAKVAFLFLPPPPHILLHPWAEMAPPGSARTDASLEKVLDWLLFNSARVRPTCSVKQPPLQHPVALSPLTGSAVLSGDCAPLRRVARRPPTKQH